MEKPIYPMKVMRITQKYEEGTHVGSFAIDDAGKDTGICPVFAPFTGIVKKIYPQDANEVWLESVDPVIYPDGTKDYMTMLFAHSDDISNIRVGQIIKQNEEFYKEGKKGKVTGNHCHMECGKGKFTGSGWYKNKSGYWSINNAKKPEECLWIDESIRILDSRALVFKKIPQPISLPPVVENTSSTPKLIFTAPKEDLYAISLKKGDQLYISE